MKWTVIALGLLLITYAAFSQAQTTCALRDIERIASQPGVVCDTGFVAITRRQLEAFQEANQPPAHSYCTDGTIAAAAVDYTRFATVSTLPEPCDLFTLGDNAVYVREPDGFERRIDVSEHTPVRSPVGVTAFVPPVPSLVLDPPRPPRRALP